MTVWMYHNEKGVCMKRGERVWISGDSSELWIQDYHVRVDTGATVEEKPSPHAKKILLTLDQIDGDYHVLCYVRKSQVTICGREA